MPSIHKRINLTVPDDIYQRIQQYKQKNGCSNDAGACLQIIVQHLNNLEEGQKMFQIVQSSSMEQLQTLMQLGAAELKQMAAQPEAISKAEEASDL